MPAFDLVVVGHLAFDVITRKGMPTQGALGGPPTYASLAARKLGASVGIISKVGDDFPIEHMCFLIANGVDLFGLKVVEGARTTNYVLEYTDGERRLVLKARGPPITPEDIPNDLTARAILAAPIAGEVSGPLITELRQHTEHLCLDPQGLVRAFLRDGTVSLVRWFDRAVLSHIDILKASLAEYEHIMGTKRLRSGLRKLHELGVGIVIITLGEDGSVLSVRGDIYAVPSYWVETSAEPTGAGDAYIGAFLAEYVRGKDPIWCACVGSAAASFVVEAFGPTRFGEKEEVLERAQELYELVVKV